VAALKWNGWQHSSGIGGNFEPEYAGNGFLGQNRQIFMGSGMGCNCANYNAVTLWPKNKGIVAVPPYVRYRTEEFLTITYH
jgi:hypothetical protein